MRKFVDKLNPEEYIIFNDGKGVYEDGSPSTLSVVDFERSYIYKEVFFFRDYLNKIK